MEQSIRIAALDLGTSKIKAMVARKDKEGTPLSVLVSEQISSDNCMRRGYVFNLGETANKITGLIETLNKKLDSPIEKIYIGIGGQSIRSESHSVKRKVPNGIVTQELLDSITEEARDFKIDSLETLNAVSPEYYLDGQLEMNPWGATCSAIEARFQLIVGRSTLKKNLFSTIELKAKLNNAGFLISPLATAEAVLSDREKELGCALIEFGAGITYVSIYKNKLLRFLVTIPLGGDVITKDIRSLDILEAESTKIHLSDRDENEQINEAVAARTDEILENVVRQIEESGYSHSLSAGIIITGGGAQLKDLPEFIRKKTGREVRLASVDRKLINQVDRLGQEPGNACIIGLLSLGTEECLKEKKVPTIEARVTDIFGYVEPPKEKPPKEKPQSVSKPPVEKKSGGLFRKISKGVDRMSNSLFGDETEK